jgi:hypothetical protein
MVTCDVRVRVRLRVRVRFRVRVRVRIRVRVGFKVRFRVWVCCRLMLRSMPSFSILPPLFDTSFPICMSALLVDDSKEAENCVVDATIVKRSERARATTSMVMLPVTILIVLDNCGLELICDLILADALIR